MKDPAYIADHIRRVLLDGGSAPHSAEVQWFFKEEVKSRGWYTAELRKVAVRFRRTLLKEHGVGYLVEVADQLYRGEILEEKVFAVFLLEKNVSGLTEQHFRLFSQWLDRASSWADHDGLVHYLIGPLIAADLRRAQQVHIWAKSKNRWRRRAAAVSLIRAMRDPASRRKAFPHLKKVSALLLNDSDDMVQKGLGWLLRESSKADPKLLVPYLGSLRDQAPRFVLHTACETLTAGDRKRVLQL